MQSAMKAEWIKSQTSEMDGLWNCGVFPKVLCSSLTPQDRVFTSHFHYKIKRKGGLVVQGQHMRRKGEDGVGDYDDAFSPLPAASGFRTILSLATQQNMFCSLTMSIFLRPSSRENFCPETVIMARSIFFDLQDMMKILSMLPGLKRT